MQNATYTTNYLPTVTTPDGRQWSAQAVADLKAEHDAIMDQRDRVQLELDLLKGKIHLLDIGRL